MKEHTKDNIGTNIKANWCICGRVAMTEKLKCFDCTLLELLKGEKVSK